MTSGSAGFLLFIGLAAAGRVLRWGKILQKPEAHTLSKVIIHCTIPAMALDSLSEHYLATWEFASLPLISIAHSSLMGLIAYGLFRRQEVRLRCLLMVSSLGFGIGQFAYPLILAAYGPTGLLYAMLFDFGNFLITFGVAYAYCIYHDEVHLLKDGVEHCVPDVRVVPAGCPPRCCGEEPAEAFMEQRILSFDSVLSSALLGPPGRGPLLSAIGKRIALRVLTFTPLLALMVGGFFSLTRLSLPAGLHVFCQSLGSANTPLVGLMLGVSLDLPMNVEKWRWVAKILSMRYSLGAATGTALYYTVDFGGSYRAVMITCLMLPPPLVLLPYSLDFGLDAELAGMIITTSIALSFGMIWLINFWFEAGSL